MRAYTEKEIREAWARAFRGGSAGALVWELVQPAGIIATHGFTDSDTVTVREIRDNAEAAGIARPGLLLNLIKESREPHYPYGSVWKDDNGVVWLRAMNDQGIVNMWLRMGRMGKYGDNEPKRPLREMEERS